MSQKFLVGGIVGGIVMFLLGWLFFGMIFKNTFPQPANMIWWALILGNILLGFTISYILSRAGVSSVSGGAMIGFTVGLLLSLGISLIDYATGGGVSNLGRKALAENAASLTIMWTVTAAVIGWTRSMGRKPLIA